MKVVETVWGLWWCIVLNHKASSTLANSSRVSESYGQVLLGWLDTFLSGVIERSPCDSAVACCLAWTSGIQTGGLSRAASQVILHEVHFG